MALLAGFVAGYSAGDLSIPDPRRASPIEGFANEPG